VQAVGIPVHSDYDGYLHDVAKRMRAEGLRVEVDVSDDRMQKKIRNAQKAKVPFMLIAGEDDVSKGAVSFRYRDGTQENGVPLDEAIAKVVGAVRDRA
jgi:threonyl-tRNA synthetase